MQGFFESGGGGGGGGAFVQVFVQSPSVALAPGVPAATALQVIVERSQRCGQEPAGGGLLVAQPAMEETARTLLRLLDLSDVVQVARIALDNDRRRAIVRGAALAHRAAVDT